MRIRDSFHSDRLPDIYYTATCKDMEPFRRLEGNARAQVCIIGGGFTGVSTALELAERGYSVALVEQNFIGWGASGRCGGQILTGPTNFSRYETAFGLENASEAWAMSTEGASIIRERVAKYAIDCDLVWGGIEVARTVSEDAGLRAKEASLRLHSKASDIEYLDISQIGRYVVSDRITSGLLRRDWGRCHPLNLVRSEARVAETLGAKIYEDARVSDITFGDTVTVDTGHGRVSADTLVVAGNAYLGQLVPTLAEKMISVGTYLMATEPVEEEMLQELLPQDFAVRAQGEGHFYFHRTPDCRLLFGAPNSSDGKHPKNLERILKRKLRSVFPALKRVKCESAWGGFIGIGETKIPQLGKLAENVFFAQAYSGRGVADAHLAGRLLAEAIAGSTDRFNVLGNLKHPAYSQSGVLRRSIGAMARILPWVGTAR